MYREKRYEKEGEPGEGRGNVKKEGSRTSGGTPAFPGEGERENASGAKAPVVVAGRRPHRYTARRIGTMMTMITRDDDISPPRRRERNREVRDTRECVRLSYARGGMPLSPKEGQKGASSVLPFRTKERERKRESRAWRRNLDARQLSFTRRPRRRQHHATCFSSYAEWRTRLIGQLRLSLVACRRWTLSQDAHVVMAQQFSRKVNRGQESPSFSRDVTRPLSFSIVRASIYVCMCMCTSIFAISTSVDFS